MQDNNTISTRMGPREWGLLIFLSILWGGSFFFNAVALEQVPPLTLVFVRVALAAVILWLWIAAAGVQMPRGMAVWRSFAVMGLLNNAVPFALIVWGQSQIASGVAAILNASTPLFTVVLAHFLTSDERMSVGRVAGVCLGLAGVAVMMGGAAFGSGPLVLLAQFACLAAALSYALAGIYGRRFRAMGLAPLGIAAGQVTASSVMMLPLVLVVDQPWTLPVPNMATMLSLFAIATFSTALAYIVYFRLLAAAGATNLLLVTLLVPVTAILLGVAVLGEVLLARQLAGMALIGAGLLAVDGRLGASLRGRLQFPGRDRHSLL